MKTRIMVLLPVAVQLNKEVPLQITRSKNPKLPKSQGLLKNTKPPHSTEIVATSATKAQRHEET
jgi:hypothetical protein